MRIIKNIKCPQNMYKALETTTNVNIVFAGHLCITLDPPPLRWKPHRLRWKPPTMYNWAIIRAMFHKTMLKQKQLLFGL